MDMKKNKWIRFLAVLFVAGTLLSGYRAQAAWQEHPSDSSKIDKSLKVKGLKAYYRIGDSATDYVGVTCTNKLKKGETLCYDMSRASDFKDEAAQVGSGYILTTGTLYIRAFLKRETSEGVVYGPYAYTTYQYIPPRLMLEVKKTTKNSVTLEFDAAGGTDGLAFEIWRAEGSGAYKLLEKTGAWAFTDSGLDPYTRYRYRVRAYSYNPYDGKTTYSSYMYCTALTWGSDLFFHASPSGSKKVQLTWTKLAGASGYRIYRAPGTNTLQSGLVGAADGWGDKTSVWRLVADLKASKSSYTDKTVREGGDYTYYIEAYRNEKSGKKTRTDIVAASDTASLGFGRGTVSLLSLKEKANGKVTATWKKVVGAKGYRIIKYDSQKQKNVVVANLKADKTSYTFTKTKTNTFYEIYAYKTVDKKEVAGDRQSIEIGRKDADKPSNVTVKPANENTAVKISWKKVPGAHHYRVYRSTAPRYLGEDGKYAFLGKQYAVGFLKGATYTFDIPASKTSIIDQRVTGEFWNGESSHLYNEGPQQGVRYYYYVQSYQSENDWQGSSCTEPVAITLPPAASGKPTVTKAAAGKKSASVAWKKVAGADVYAVYYSTSKNGSYRCFGRTTGTSLKVTGLTPGKKYYFKVRAIGQGRKQEDISLGLSAAKASNANIKK